MNDEPPLTTTKIADFDFYDSVVGDSVADPATTIAQRFSWRSRPLNRIPVSRVGNRVPGADAVPVYLAALCRKP
jgi:hypothetical protein